MTPALSAVIGTNAELLPSTLEIHAPEGWVADVTWGDGVFWRGVDLSRWRPVGSDLAPRNGCHVVADFRCLPYADGSVPVVIFDPPYMHGGDTVKASINCRYRNASTDHSHAAVVERYMVGLVEAKRVLRRRGVLLVKCQDETVGGKQQWSHVEVLQILELLDFEVVDLRVLVQTTQPCMRHDYQKTSRKNHSYLWVARKRGRSDA